MPTYEYRCPNGHDFERFFRSISTAQGEVNCPTCGLVGARRMSAGAGLLFKGSGFYITDYGKDGKKDQRSAPAKAEGAGTGAGEGGSSGGDGAKGTESKPSPESKPAAETKAPAPAAAPAPKSSGPSE
jgi:putative FmdB family regulatory protein